MTSGCGQRHFATFYVPVAKAHMTMITVNTNYQSDLNNNLLDLMWLSCFNAGCFAGYNKLPCELQPEMFLLLTEGLICDECQAVQKQPVSYRNPTAAKTHISHVIFNSFSPAVFSLCVSPCHCSAFTQREFLHTEGLTLVCHLEAQRHSTVTVNQTWAPSISVGPH